MMRFITRNKSPNRRDVDDRFVSQLRVRITFNYLYYYNNYYLHSTHYELCLCPEIIIIKKHLSLQC